MSVRPATEPICSTAETEPAIANVIDGRVHELGGDSLGSRQTIRPGDINWMTAGRGIVHSERTAADRRGGGARLHGLQLWVALPVAHEEAEPSFHHHPGADLPERDRDGVRIKVLAGPAFGLTSPVETLSPLFYVDVAMSPGSSLAIPREHEERARLVLLGGAPPDGERHIFWNFVSSSRERIERAARDWKERRFPKVPGDESEFVPLPDWPGIRR